MKEKMAKKMRVHWVQRQDLRTVTKEPMTGLERGVLVTLCFLEVGKTGMRKGRGEDIP